MKLSLLFPDKKISIDDMKQSISNSSKFSILEDCSNFKPIISSRVRELKVASFEEVVKSGLNRCSLNGDCLWISLCIFERFTTFYKQGELAPVFK